MLRVICEHCKHSFESGVVNPGKVYYRGCDNIFRLEYNVKLPCPNCRNILNLYPAGNKMAKGIPIKAENIHEKTTASLLKDERTDPPLNPHQTRVRSTAKVGSKDATAIKPFRVLVKDQAKIEPIRLHLKHGKVDSNSKPSRKAAWHPVGHGFAALCFSAFMTFGFLSIKNKILPQNLENAAMEPLDELGDEKFEDSDSLVALNESADAMGGPTEDLVADRLKTEDEQDLLLANRYKKNEVLMLPDLQKLSSTYGVRLDPFTRKMAFHGGIDFRGPVGEKVFAALDGIVKHAGPRGRYGKLVVIAHANGLESRYAHLSSVYVKRGQKITKGTKVGAIGNSGRSTGPHLHFELLRKGQKINPLTAKIR